MLVLSRYADQSIMIGDDIEIKVVRVSGDKVRLGIEAPKSVTVHRREVYEAVRRKNLAVEIEHGEVDVSHGLPPALEQREQWHE